MRSRVKKKTRPGTQVFESHSSHRSSRADDTGAVRKLVPGDICLLHENENLLLPDQLLDLQRYAGSVLRDT